MYALLPFPPSLAPSLCVQTRQLPCCTPAYEVGLAYIRFATHRTDRRCSPGAGPGRESPAHASPARAEWPVWTPISRPPNATGRLPSHRKRDPPLSSAECLPYFSAFAGQTTEVRRGSAASPPPTHPASGAPGWSPGRQPSRHAHAAACRGQRAASGQLDDRENRWRLETDFSNHRNLFRLRFAGIVHVVFFPNNAGLCRGRSTDPVDVERCSLLGDRQRILPPAGYDPDRE